jgi:hypothetical protein
MITPEFIAKLDKELAQYLPNVFVTGSYVKHDWQIEIELNYGDVSVDCSISEKSHTRINLQAVIHELLKRAIAEFEKRHGTPNMFNEPFR